MIQAIETYYAGYRFRSRLEARWAVFFDALDIPWEYEPQGYLVGAHGAEYHRSGACACGSTKRPYLPDFRIYLSYEKTPVWVEVKGSEDNLDKFLMIQAVDWGEGLPDVTNTSIEGYGLGDHCYYTARDVRGGLLILGDIPQWSGDNGIPRHTILTHDKGVARQHFLFRPSTYMRCRGVVMTSLDIYGYHDSSTGVYEPDGAPYSWTNPPRMYDCPVHLFRPEKDLLRGAYDTARQARFEHGQRG